MKIIIRCIKLTILSFFIFSCAAKKASSDNIKYFNENDIEISKSEFEEILSTNKLLEIPGEFANHKKLTLRSKRGKINNRPDLESIIEKNTNQKIDSDKPIVIIYYPGKDPCNSSGSGSMDIRKMWYDDLETGIANLIQTKPIYIYKNKDGLKKFSGITGWHKDPEQTVEKLFFQYHYPCCSFVVISKDGDYISYFGEFGIDYVFSAIQIISK